MEVTTILILIGITFFLIIYDIYAESKNNDFTISVIIGSAARKAPMIAFAFGVLMGHFFWGQCLNLPQNSQLVGGSKPPESASKIVFYSQVKSRR